MFEVNISVRSKVMHILLKTALSTGSIRAQKENLGFFSIWFIPNFVQHEKIDLYLIFSTTV